MGRKRRTVKRTKKQRKGNGKRLLRKVPGKVKAKTYVTSLAKTLDVSTRISQKSVYDISYLNTFTCYPGLSAPAGRTNGCFIQTFWANSCQSVMFPDPTSVPVDYNVGVKIPQSGTAPYDFDGSVDQCTIPQQFWKNCEVISADIEIIATPMLNTATDLASTNFNPRSLCWLTLSRDWNPQQSGPTMDLVYDNAVIQNGRYTITATSEFQYGANPISAVLRGSFTPKKVFNVQDIADREGAFRAAPTVGNVQITGKQPASGAFWNFGISSASPMITTAHTPTLAYDRGNCSPHTVQVKINYRTKWMNLVQPSTTNNPL